MARKAKRHRIPLVLGEEEGAGVRSVLVGDWLVRRWGRLPRWLFAVSDQGVIAGINLLMAVAVARVGGVAGLGQYTVVATTMLLAMTLQRMLVLDAWLASRQVTPRPTAELRTLVVACTLIATIAALVVVLLSTDRTIPWLLVTLVAPLYLLQDFGRYAAFKNDDSPLALLSDALILVAGVAAVAFGHIIGHRGEGVVLVGWLIGYACGTLVCLTWTWGGLVARGGLTWWSVHCRPLASKLTHEGLAFVIGVGGSIYLLAGLASRHEVGVARMAQTAYSPMGLVVTGISMWLIPTLARQDRESGRQITARATTILTAGSVPILLISAAIGPWLISLVFGVADPPSRATLLLAGGSTALVAVGAPWVATVRVSGNFSPIAWARTAGAVLIWGGLLVVATSRTADGFLVLLAIQNVLVTGTSIAVGTRLRSGPPGDSVTPDTAAMPG